MRTQTKWCISLISVLILKRQLMLEALLCRTSTSWRRYLQDRRPPTSWWARWTSSTIRSWPSSACPKPPFWVTSRRCPSLLASSSSSLAPWATRTSSTRSADPLQRSCLMRWVLWDSVILCHKCLRLCLIFAVPKVTCIPKLPCVCLLWLCVCLWIRFRGW